MPRPYRYVGPRDLLQLATSPVARCQPQNASALRRWVVEQGSSWPVILTFVVTQNGSLRISPRHAEHVACAEIAAALERIGLEPPSGLAHAFAFRRCPGCHSIVVVKEDAFECAGCGSELPQAWNLETDTAL